MRLISNRCVNFCQHEDRFIEFQPGLVGIFGPNGIGKTNFMNSAYTSLTNDYRRADGNKEANVRQTADQEAQAYIESVWLHEGQTFTIKRGLRKVRDSLTLAEGEPIRGEAAISSALEKILGVPLEIINEIVFASQGDDSFAFIMGTEAQRSKIFSFLSNTEKAEEIYGLVGKQRTADLPLLGEMAFDIDELSMEVSKLDKQIREHKKQIKEHEKNMLSTAEYGQLQALANAATSYKLLSSQLKNHREQLANRKTAKKQAAGLVVKLTVRLRQEKEGLEQADADYEKAEANADLWAKYDDWRNKRNRLVSRVEQLDEEDPEPISDLLSVTDLMELSLKAQVKFNKADAFIKAFAGSVVECPTCSTPVSKLHGDLEAARRDHPKLQAELKRLEGQIKERKRFDKEHADWRLAQKERETTLKSLEKQLDDLGSERPPSCERVDETELQTKMKRKKNFKQRVDDVREQLAAATQSEATATANVSNSVGEIHKLKEQLERLEIDDASASEAAKKIAAHDAADAVLQYLTQAMRGFEIDQAAKRKDLQDAKNLHERTKAAKDWIGRLETIQGVLHRENLPRIVAQSYLAAMEDDINATLELFESPFRITAGEALTLNAHFTTGKKAGVVMPAKRLSKGEKAVLALAYRVAAKTVFASQINMMSLDEPTTGLDDKNLSYLEVALARLKELTRREGSQIIMITHSQKLSRVMDQVITLEPGI